MHPVCCSFLARCPADMCRLVVRRSVMVARVIACLATGEICYRFKADQQRSDPAGHMYLFKHVSRRELSFESSSKKPGAYLECQPTIASRWIHRLRSVSAAYCQVVSVLTLGGQRRGPVTCIAVCGEHDHHCAMGHKMLAEATRCCGRWTMQRTCWHRPGTADSSLLSRQSRHMSRTG